MGAFKVCNDKKMKKYPKFSIIIPLYIQTPYFHEAVEKCLELDYPDFEILIGADKKAKLDFKDKRVRILRTGLLRTGPAEKRDIGIVKSKGEFIAFLDDDSYPAKDWLKKAAQVLRKKKTASVCGPGLTPPADGFAQKITGAILASPFGSGPYSYRFAKKKAHFVDDYPAYNMVVDKKTLLEVGGFGTKYYGGEDTALCLKLINAGKRIYYHPDIVVYHHRRKFPFEYMRQVGNVGLHRGYFAKAYPQTSFRPSYFGPAALTIGLALLVLWSFFSSQILSTLAIGFCFFYFLVFIENIKRDSLFINIILPLAILINYFSYGVQFIQGLVFTKELER